MGDASIERFATYSNDELTDMHAQLERAHDERLEDLIAAIRAELERRRQAVSERASE